MSEFEVKDLLAKINDHEKRIRLFEDLFLINNKKTGKKQIKKVNTYKGPKGGVLFLIEKGFFKKRNNVNDVCVSLEKEGYNYKREVIQTALNRLSVKNGLLVKIEENGKKIYVQRK